MTYKAKDYSHLLGTKGFSDQLLQNHFKLYEGYVNNTNKLLELFKSVDKTTPQWAELKRRFGWEFNGMRLHELYFGNVNKEKKTLAKDSPLYAKMVEQFDSGEHCREDFIAAGKMRGIGWVIMTYDPVADKLINVWINEHDVGHLAGTVPLLVMDVFEHAFMLDYGLDRASYINAFIDAIDWEEVERRFVKATS